MGSFTMLSHGKPVCFKADSLCRYFFVLVSPPPPFVLIISTFWFSVSLDHSIKMRAPSNHGNQLGCSQSVASSAPLLHFSPVLVFLCSFICNQIYFKTRSGRSYKPKQNKLKIKGYGMMDALCQSGLLLVLQFLYFRFLCVNTGLDCIYLSFCFYYLVTSK